MNLWIVYIITRGNNKYSLRNARRFTLNDESGVDFMEKLLTRMYNSDETGKSKEQYRVLNALLLLALVNLTVFYFVYQLNIVGSTELSWQQSEVFSLWQRASLFCLIVLTGMLFKQFSGYLQWGLGLSLLGVVVTLSSSFFLAQPVYYGIFTFLGIAFLAVPPLYSWLSKAPGSCGLLLSAIGYELSRRLAEGLVIWQGKVIGHLPSFLYGDWNAWLGLPGADFVSPEYVPFLPNIFLFLGGLYLFQFMSEHEKGRRYLAKLR